MSRTKQSVFFRVPPSQATEIKAIAERLGLPASEILRRVVRIGLSEFEGVQIPGGPETESDVTKWARRIVDDVFRAHNNEQPQQF